MTDRVKVSSSFRYNAGPPPASLLLADLTVIGIAVKSNLEAAVNAGVDVSFVVFVHPGFFLPSQLFFMDDIEGTVFSSSVNHLLVVSDQGARKVMVHVVGGSMPLAIAHAVDEAEPEEDDNDPEEELEPEDEPAEDEPAEDEPEQEAELDDDDSDATHASDLEGEADDDGADEVGDDSSSDGEEFIGLSQLTI